MKKCLLLLVLLLGFFAKIDAQTAAEFSKTDLLKDASVEPVGLLLPAIQKVREAAARANDPNLSKWYLDLEKLDADADSY